MRTLVEYLVACIVAIGISFAASYLCRSPSPNGGTSVSPTDRFAAAARLIEPKLEILQCEARFDKIDVVSTDSLLVPYTGVIVVSGKTRDIPWMVSYHYEYRDSHWTLNNTDFGNFIFDVPERLGAFMSGEMMLASW